MAKDSQSIPSPLQFDLIDLPQEGMTLEGEIPFAQLQLEEEARRAYPLPLHYNLQLSAINTGHDLLVRGHLWSTIRVVCDRCDEPFDWTLDTTDVCHQYENAFGTTIDLTDGLREDILMTFPQHFLCKETCKGLCPRCGRNLNLGPCACPPEEPALPPDPSDSPWSQLDKLTKK